MQIDHLSKDKDETSRYVAKEMEKVKPWMLTLTKNPYGFEGLCAVEEMSHIKDYDIVAESPDLSKLCVELMKSVSDLVKEG